MTDLPSIPLTPPAPGVSPQAGHIKPRHTDNISRGVIFGLLAMFLLAIMAAFAKALSVHHNTFEIIFYRNSIAIIPMVFAIAATGKTHLLKVTKPLLLFLRVFIGVFSLAALFESYALLPLADATVIVMTAALFAPALAHFTLKERVGPRRWAAIVIGLLGVAIMARPSGHLALLGTLTAFLTAFLQGFTQVLLRGLKTENSFTVTFYFILGGAILSGLLMPFFGHIPARGDIPLIIGIGAAGGLAQFCLASAFRSAPAPVIAPLNYTGLIWASGLDIIVWHRWPGLPIYIGAAIIIASQAYIIHRDRVAEKRVRA